MGILVRDGGVWKDSEPYVKDAGIWKPVDTGYVKDAGVWKEAYSSGWVLEGSWETGWEGWVSQSTGKGQAIHGSFSPVRTGSYNIALSSLSGSGILEYTVPSEIVTEFVKLSVWVYSGSTVNVHAKIGSGGFNQVAANLVTGAYTLVEAHVHNPGLEPVTFRIQPTAGSGHRVDDWKIEGSASFIGSLPPVGSPLFGGYLIGSIVDGGITFGLIDAPKSTGQINSTQWKTSNTETPGTSSDTNGFANCEAMNNASHPAAQWCRSRSINGYSDWYLPARDELDERYANRFAIVGEDSIDVDATWYWSSTHNTATTAWRKRLSDGEWNGSGGKNVGSRVRAMRRFPL